jgi:3-oxoacyl-[acyl-carrier protein] reductase
MFDLTGKAALVTGASGGIGGAIAKGLHRQGAAVVLSGTRAEALEALKAEMGERAHVITAKMDDAADLERLVKESDAAMGKVDILVNNAGITRDMLALRLKDEDWSKVLEINLTGAFRLSRAVMRGMMRRRFGRIVTITSVVGVTGNAGQANYAASKAGVIGFAKAVALEVASRNITVNVVAPGLIETDMTRGLTTDARETWELRIPLRRLGSADDVAGAVCFLASDEASYITGQVLAVNGGMYM